MKLLIDLNNRLWIPATFLVLVATTTASLWPADQLPKVPGTDKTHHFIAYLLLMLPTAIRKPKYWQGFAVFFIAWSGAIELIQPYVNRYGEWLDLAANAGGVFLAIMLAWLVNILMKKGV